MATTALPDPLTGQCRTIQIIEPDSQLLVATSSGSVDPALDESGSVILAIDQNEVSVVFAASKLSAAYKFEYLYVDAFGIINPGTIEPVVITQTVLGFTVDLAGEPPIEGYILRWRVVVASIDAIPIAVDTPESFYLQLPRAAIFTVTFTNPRSIQTYGFSELRVENLVDLPSNQTPILAQVTTKTFMSFSVGLNPKPPTDNYFLVARIP